MLLSPKQYQAVIFDLDGVITKTQAQHAAAWAEVFNAILKPGEPRFSQEDYEKYVDGKPRYEGVQGFLKSRGIDLPWGTPSDDTDTATVCGLGNRKNQLFVERIRRDGVEVFPSSKKLIEELRESGVKLGVVTSSKNCHEVLQMIQLTDVFQASLDGIDEERLKLKGKPEPDTYLEVAKRLGVIPDKAVVIEDALAGVESGRRGGFGLVIGVDRSHKEKAMKEAGADIVVHDLAEVGVEKPSAHALIPELKRQKLAFFLDYDGTLTPIVDRPERALLSASMRDVLTRLSSRYPVAIISGRDRLVIERLVNIPNVIYAGSHGFDITGPDGLKQEYEPALELLPDLSSAAEQLDAITSGITGAWVERKRFALAVHYRQVQEKDVSPLEHAVNDVVKKFPRLKKAGGKKIFELKPNLPWDKGKAVLWLADRLHLNDCRLVYIGDDVTDEDAFAVLSPPAVTICVEAEEHQTQARYMLESVQDVETYLKALT